MKKEIVQFWLKQIVYKQVPYTGVHKCKEFNILKDGGLDIVLDLEGILKENNLKEILYLSILLEHILEDKPKELNIEKQTLSEVRESWLKYLSQSNNKKGENDEEE